MALQIEDVELNLDQSLVARTQLGDSHAFEELYRRHHQRLYRFCLYRLGEPHEAQDVAQEAFARAWAHLPRMEGELRFYAWLRTIAANLCTDVGRRRARTRPEADVDPGPVDGAQDAVVDQVDIELLHQALARLPERHRRVLELREHDGLSYEQLAERTGTNIGTIESLLWRARQGLRRQYAAVSGEGGLAAVAGTGWMLQRAHGLHARLAARVALANPSLASALSSAIGGVAVGSVAAAALSLSGLGGSAPAGSVQSNAYPRAAYTVPAPAALVPALPVPALPVPTAAPTASSAPAAAGVPAPAPTARPALTDPVHTNAAAARQEARTDPVRASLLGVAVGVDPRAALDYVRGFLPDLP